ncbi:S53 family peptidase [Solimicrobium silvestre]|uniref:Pro-kumamolisin, activation domain n=1 Tax=Solimicrobium silvestre TaxID=2099400 RepID=A0A2S9H0A1_9BURK|nr:S53 family peptidase [Solimicrobium silvestre]PRC93412.1 Pro-kumamolisin, activation domain [Solimicrobium silvestre]
MKLKTKPLAAAVSGLFIGALCLPGSAFAAKSLTTAQDTGAISPTQTQTVSIVLQLRNANELNKYINDTVDPNSPNYHHFLSVDEFAHRYAPTDADVNRVKADLGKLGIQVSEVYRSHMVIRATGSTAQFNKYLATEVHSYKENGLSYIKPSVALTIPSSVSDVVMAVIGLNTKPKLHSLSHNLAKDSGGTMKMVPGTKGIKLANGVTTTNSPGSFTVTDVAELYNINPLYQQGILGQNHNIGIATFATFTASDAYTYWQTIGLHVASDRITEIPVDGGTGTNGSGETTLDVEQSGGVAPAAKVYVYEAPNTDQGFADVFLKAAADNTVDTLSMSWGGTEFGQDTGVMPAVHQALMELAAQGISVLTSSGDEGAYDINNNQGYYYYPGCTATLSVEYPASDSMILAAGGITLAGTQTFYNSNNVVVGSVTVPKDRAWAWDYLQNFFITNFGDNSYYEHLFPVGGGGGVSVEFDLPYYQQNLHGTQVTAANQALICQTSTGPVDLIDLPDGYAGRNVPDISLNADPDTGYAEYVGGQWAYYWGGTSFVAPQLNGMAILVSQVSGTRLGFLNPQLYSRFNQFGYGSNSPFRAVTAGDNEYYQSTYGYSPATGIGAIDVTKLAKSFSRGGY